MSKAKTHTHSFCVALPFLLLLEGVLFIFNKLLWKRKTKQVETVSIQRR